MKKTTQLSYYETSLIVIALDYYKIFISNSYNESLKKVFNNNIDVVMEKFEKLEKEILKLKYEEEI